MTSACSTWCTRTCAAPALPRLNIIPTTTGAARAVALVLPELQGKLHGIAFRIPTPTVSMCDFVADLKKEVTVEQVNAAFKAASEGPMKHIMEYSEEELVSMDFKGDPCSCIVDALSTMVMDKTMVKTISWYDNEWGYSCRLADLAAFVAEQGTVALSRLCEESPMESG